MMMIVLGCDPGLDGGLVWLDANRRILSMVVMPTLKTDKGRYYDVSAIRNLFTGSLLPSACYIEKALQMPGNGRRSYGMMMRCLALVEMACMFAGVPYNEVSPSVWMREVLTDYPKTDKKASVLYAQQHYPTIQFIKSDRSSVYHTGLTDALGIAVYGVRQEVKDHARTTTIA